MKTKSTIFLFLFFVGFTFHELSAQDECTYNEHDVEKVKAYVRQNINTPTAELSPSDTLNWDTSNDWISKLGVFSWKVFDNLLYINEVFHDCPTLIGYNCTPDIWGKLDLEGCQHLEAIHVFLHGIEYLNVSDCPNLEEIRIINGKLSGIDFKNCPQLKSINASSNRLTFNAFYKIMEIEQNLESADYLYQNEINLSESYPVNTPIDLAFIGAKTYKWIDSQGGVLKEGEDYRIDRNTFTFLKTTRQPIHCEMTNSDFPNITRKTSYISITSPLVIEYNQHDVEKLKAFLNQASNAGFFNAYITDNDDSWLSKTTGIEWVISDSEYRLKGISFTDDVIRPLEGGLDFSGCSQLAYINFRFIYNITQYNFEGCSNLQTLIAYGGSSSPVNLSGCKKLESLNISGIKNNIDLTDCPDLKVLSLQGDFEEIDLSKQSKLQTLSLSGKFSKIDLTQNNMLYSLKLSGNNLKDIDLTNNVQLTDIDLSNNSLSLLNLKNQAKAYNINANDNKLTNIELPQRISLSTLNLSNNNLNNNLALAEIVNISDLDISNNPLITELNTSMLPERIIDFVAKNHNIEEADFSKTSEIRDIIMTNGKLKKLKLHPQVSIFKLEVSLNQIKSLDDISKLSDINELYILNNQLTTVDIAKLPKTQILNIAGNRVSELNIPENSNIRGFSLYDNNFNFNNLPYYEQFPRMAYAHHLEIKNQKTDIESSYTLQEAVIDLSHLGGTEYRWYGDFSEWGDQPANTFYRMIDGKTTFIKETAGEVYCEITNLRFPATKIITNKTKIGKGGESLESSPLGKQVKVYSDKAGELKLVAPVDSRYTIYTTAGTAIAKGLSEGEATVSAPQGIYLVQIEAAGTAITQKVIVK